MEKKCSDNRNGGFSLVEMLAVVAILVILLGISMVAAAGYRDMLKLTELDNAAREIYMAAENRAVLLSGARRLSDQLGKKAPDPQLDHVSKASVTEDLLPTGSIDPALRNGDFYIVYDRDSGSVTDVFYAESSMDSLMTDGFDKFYDDWAKSRSERLKLKDTMLVGWYNGEAAQGEDVKLDIPKEPTIKVMIENGEELTVTVEYTAPGPAELSVKLGDVALTDGTYDARKRDVTTLTGANGTAYACTWVLDSLTREENGEERKWSFKELRSGITPGENFTVTATITSADSAFPEASASDTNNSLFQEGSGLVTEDGGEQVRVCYIRTLRHLQNLDAKTYKSGVPTTTKIRAVQTADIRCKDNETYGADGEYKSFTPIDNAYLKSYDGRTNEIRNLDVESAGPAGLFGQVSGTTLKNIRLVNATVKAKNGSAGALAGEAENAVIQNCRVYWELDESLKAELIKDAANNEYNYQITGTNAGGLVGYAKGTCDITTSLAATLVSGTDCAGGLIGQYDGDKATVTYSYADCYLTGTGTGDASKAAGLIGDLKTGTAELKNCYAAGFIMGGKSAAGLCLGEGTTDATNVYSVMRYPGRTLGNTFTYLTQKQASDSFTNTHFLYNKTVEITLSSGKKISGVSFDDMYKSDFVGTMKGAFEKKTPEDSHPYELRSVPLVYDYPGLKSLPHYGDWGRELAALSLVYYENDDGVNRVSGIGIRDLNDSTTEVTKDGYALLLRKEEGDDGKTVSATFSYLDKNGAAKKTLPKPYTLTGAREIEADGKKDYYYVLPLPDDLVNSDYAEEQFFRYIQFELTKPKGSETATYEGEAFFNPHFAETVQTARRLGAGEVGGWDKTSETEYAKALAGVMGEIKLRTPRHLYDLSQFEEYYTRRNVFHQILPLDYSTYAGYNDMVKGAPFVQQPIGSGKTDPKEGKNDAFEGTYDGDCNVIKNVVFKTEDQYAGLFGYSKGTLRDIVYELDPEHPVTAKLDNSTGYVGALAGANGGTVDNCAVYGLDLRVNVSGGTLYLGGLAGWNSGTIRSSAAQSAGLTVNCFSYAKVYVGGLMGENDSNGVVTTSYAVARMNTEVDATARAARICGFVGWNSGSIYNSYAAADLGAGGERVDTCGFCGERAGRQSGNAYLDRGNFSYYGTAYAASYQRDGDKAASTPYAELTAKEKATAMGMGTVWTGDAPDPGVEYPYPAAVKNAAGKYVHYGQWPVPMPLGDMGVFYWEKMVDASDSKSNPTYHMSVLAVDPEKKTITGQSTLSTAHDDGRVVTEYGYGYYTEKDKMVTFSAENISYVSAVFNGRVNRTSNGDLIGNRNKGPDAQLVAISPIGDSLKGAAGAAEALKEQTAEAEKYDFYCWTSFHEGGRPSWVKNRAPNDMRPERVQGTTAGLSPWTQSDANNGKFTLTSGGVAVVFNINTQFADSMALIDSTGWTLKGDVPTAKPGESGNPFKIRCGTQLQEINWMGGVWTDTSVGSSNASVGSFPYLSGSGSTKKFYWEQTHDIDWVAEGNTYKWITDGNVLKTGVFMGIAQTQASGNSLPGWFGGSYDGQNYTMKNLKISKNGGEDWNNVDDNAYDPNCMGLFGAVKDATLKNIVMFSESGNDVVTVMGRKSGSNEISHRNTADTAWYAGGVLAGVAQGSTITNCAVAGYTIRDVTERVRCTYKWNGYTPENYDMGGAIGGLVGMTDSPLTGCTASAKIEIACDHRHTHGGLGRMDESMVPVRVGGLVGSTTSTVTNCYTGGTIDVSRASNASIYAGRLIGGVGAEPLGSTENTAKVENCYSYLTLPEKKGVVKEVYNIGGAGRDNSTGTVTTTNDYYYGTDVSAGGGTSVTHRQLSGLDPIDGQTIYEKLTAYSPVSTQVDGLDAPGRFSYAPRDREDLKGRDYPFPTILTMDGYHVHYGAWSLGGIVRPGGGGPIELDMFAGNGTCREHSEKLTVENVASGGTWSVEISDESVVDPEPKPKEIITQDGQLTVKALKASDTPVTVTVKYTIGDVEYSLPITVYVDDGVELRPGAAGIFPSDAVTVPLRAYGKTRPGEQTYDVPLKDGTLTLVKAERVDGPVTAMIEGSGVKLARGGEETARTQQWVEVTYTYEKDGYPSQEKTHRLAAELLTLPEGIWSEDGLTWTMDFKDYKVGKLKAELADPAPAGFTAAPDGAGTETAVTLTKAADADFPPEGVVKLTVTLTMDGLDHTLTVTVPPKPETGEGT